MTSKESGALAAVIVFIVLFPLWMQLAILIVMAVTELLTHHGLALLVFTGVVPVIILSLRKQRSSSREVQTFLNDMKGRK